MAHLEDCLRTYELLAEGQWLASKNSLFRAIMQRDGNFVVYRGSGPVPGINTALWSTTDLGNQTQPDGSFSINMQGDGNLVIRRRDPSAEAIWSLHQAEQYPSGQGYWMRLNDDGNLVVGPDEGTWSSRVWASERTDSVDQDSIELDHVEYDLASAKVVPKGPPKTTLSSTAVNRTTVKQNTTLEMDYNKVVTFGWASTTALKVGVASEFKVKIPLVAESKVTLSAEFSESFEVNKTSTESTWTRVTLDVGVPPGHSVRGRCTWQESALSLPFVATGKAYFNGLGKKVPFRIDGTYNGLCSHDVRVSWEDLDEGKSHVVSARIGGMEVTNPS